MPTATSYVVQTFDRTDSGLVAGKELPCRSEADAVQTGGSVVPTKAGAVAIEATRVDGVIRKTVVLQRWGDVPEGYLAALARD